MKGVDILTEFKTYFLAFRTYITAPTPSQDSLGLHPLAFSKIDTSAQSRLLDTESTYILPLSR